MLMHTGVAGQSGKEAAFTGLAAWLSGGFVLMTGLLTAVGSYTGGVARIMRNDPGHFRLALIGAFVAVLLGVVAAEVAKAKRSSLLLTSGLLVAGVAVFLGSMYAAISAAAYSSTLNDRPSLDAQLVSRDRGVWAVRGTAATSGLESDGRLQVLVYGVPAEGGDPVRLLFLTSGPDADGVAEADFRVPLPRGDFDAFVVTANTGTLPRDCSGANAYYVQSDPVGLTLAHDFVEEWQNACVTLAPPPDLSGARTVDTRSR